MIRTQQNVQGCDSTPLSRRYGLAPKQDGQRRAVGGLGWDKAVVKGRQENRQKTRADQMEGEAREKTKGSRRSQADQLEG